MNERNDVVGNVNVNCVIMWMDGLDVFYLFKFMNECFLLKTLSFVFLLESLAMQVSVCQISISTNTNNTPTLLHIIIKVYA